MKRFRLPLLIGLALVAAACGGDNDTGATTTAGGTATTTTAAAETTTTTAGGGGEATTTTAADVTADLTLDDTINVFDAAGVDSYRERLTFKGSGPAVQDDPTLPADEVVLEADFTRDASRVSFGMGTETLESITIGDTSWTRFGADQPWTESPAGVDPMAGLTSALLSQDVLGDVNEYVTTVGTENVNGRSTVHYRVDKAGFEESAAASGQPISLTEAQLDVWIDQAGEFTVKWELVMDGTGFDDANPDAQGRLELSLELYDFGAAITIEPPV